MQQPSRTSYIDNLRVVTTIAVIALHVAAPAVVVLFNKQGPQPGWWAGNFYDSLFRPAVPIFVMITGALLLPQVIGLRDFLQKRLKRILMPFIFWSIIYLVFFLALKVRDEGTATLQNIAPWIGTQLLQGSAAHLWYVYMIIGIYLFIPIIKPWVQTASNKALFYFLIIWIITLVINQQKIFLVDDTPLNIRYFSGYIGYLILGYYMANRMIVTKNIMAWAAFFLITGYLVTLYGTYVLSTQNGMFSDSYYEYLTINVMLMTASIFTLFKGSNPTLSIRLIAGRSLISKYGYGIYLNHFLVLSVISYFHFDYSFANPIISIPAITLVCLAISTLMVYILQQLPYGKYISG